MESLRRKLRVTHDEDIIYHIKKLERELDLLRRERTKITKEQLDHFLLRQIEQVELICGFNLKEEK